MFAFPDDRRLVLSIGCEMPVKAIVAGVELTLDKPLHRGVALKNHGPGGRIGSVAEDVTEILRGCAIAAKDTGVPISTHSHPADRNGIDQLDFFRSEGVDLTRVIVGHSGDTDDLDYLKRLMDTGATIGSDRFGLTMPGTPDNDARVQVIATLCEQGYADRIVVSHDTMMHTDWFADARVIKQNQPNWRIAYIAEYVLPALKEAGVNDEQLHSITIGNPARLLALRA